MGPSSAAPVVETDTRNPEETKAVAARVASVARPGDVILLDGELGAGKTVFVQGFAEALGYRGPVTSPTFVLVQHYAARIPIVHADMYRLGSLGEVLDLGLPELGESAVTIIEWGEAAVPAVGPDHLSVRIEILDETTRRLRLSASGEAWRKRLEPLGAGS